MRGASALLGFVVVGCAAGPGRPASAGGAEPHWSCEVRVAPALDRVELRTCFETPPAGLLVPADRDGRELLERARIVGRGGERAAALSARGVRLDGVRAGECVELQLAVPDRARGFLGTSHVGGDVLVSPRLFLWSPQAGADPAGVELTLRLPRGIHSSVPWPRIAPERYRLDATALRWRSFAAFGRFATDRIELPGGALDVSCLGGRLAASTGGVRRWLSAAGRGVVSLLGTMPAPRIQVLLLPAPGVGEPVFFGATGRGGGSGVVLFASALASDDDLMNDWVAPHELVHFAMPTVPDEDAWFSEGFATYYQEVLRARAGTRTARGAWAALVDGFGRGHASAGERTLRQQSATMHRWRAYQRVYWGGAAIAFLADVEIRRASHNRASLDSAIREIAACCLQRTIASSADELLDHVSAAAGGDALRRIATRVLASTEMPDVDAALARLGVPRGGAGGAELDPSAPEAWIRDAITAPIADDPGRPDRQD